MDSAKSKSDLMRRIEQSKDKYLQDGFNSYSGLRMASDMLIRGGRQKAQVLSKRFEVL